MVSGDDAQIAKSGELPPRALVRVDAIRKACLTNLDCAGLKSDDLDLVA
jgi:hypothetical protein